MEPVAWLEVLGPWGKVLHRHAAYRWPIRLSQNYTGDIVLDDPLLPDMVVGKLQNEDGTISLTLQVTGTEGAQTKSPALFVNGKEVSGNNAPVNLVGGDEIIQCGATQMRVRLRGHTVKLAQASGYPAWQSSWFTAIAIATGSILFFAYFSFANSVEEDITKHVKNFGTALMMLTVWWGFWISASRLASGHFCARQHLLITGLLYLGLEGFDQIASIAAFATGIYAVTTIGKIFQLAALGVAVYAHLLFVKPARLVPSVLRASVVPALTWFFLMDGMSTIYPVEQQPIAYNASIWPAYFLVSKGDPTDTLFQDLAEAKETVDKAALVISARR